MTKILQSIYEVHPYPNHDLESVSIRYHTRLFPCEAIRRPQGLANLGKTKLSFSVFFVELKEASRAIRSGIR